MTTIQAQVGDKVYRLGDTGPVVEQIQLGLRAVGYNLRGTGYFGPATDTAVTTFQRRAGLVADGKFGAKSAAALDLALVRPAEAPALAPAAEVGRPLWLEAGLALIGTKEGAGAADNNQIINWAKEEGGDIAKAYTHDEIPWCALFANHILTHVGLKGTETLWALDFAGKWPSVQLAGPAVGAFAPMLRNGGGHIICIVGKARSGNIMGLGGNQHDAVNISEFPLARLNKGFWWPEGQPLPAVGVAALPVIESDGRISSRES